jgi:predicted HTH domain antitoxin
MKKEKKREIKFEIPEDVFLAAHMSEEQITSELHKLIAFKLFADGHLSGGRAAKLAGMTRIHFLLEAGTQGIEWLPYSADEVRRELQ